MTNTSIKRLPDSWESKLIEENNFLKEFIRGASVEKIEALESDVKTLTSERDNLRGQLSQYDETVKAIKAEAAARIEAATKSHTDGSNRQRGVWEAKVRDLASDLNRSEAKVANLSKEVESLKSENIRLEGELKSKDVEIGLLKTLVSTTDRVETKIDEILDIVKSLIKSGAPAEVILDKIEEVKRVSSVEERIRALVSLEAQGFTSAKELIPKLEHLGVRQASRISELRNKPLYKKLKEGGGSNVEA